jgi:uncharacterized small protein (DUF1192 family)
MHIGPTQDDDDDDICKRCHEAYDMPDGAEPTPYCNQCAHELVEEQCEQIAALTKERDEAVKELAGHKRHTPDGCIVCDTMTTYQERIAALTEERDYLQEQLSECTLQRAAFEQARNSEHELAESIRKQRDAAVAEMVRVRGVDRQPGGALALPPEREIQKAEDVQRCEACVSGADDSALVAELRRDQDSMIHQIALRNERVAALERELAGKQCPTCGGAMDKDGCTECRPQDERIAVLEAEVADFKANNRYQHGYGDGERDAKKHAHERILALEAQIATALVIVGTTTDCQCQGDAACLWCKVRAALEVRECEAAMEKRL